MGAFTSSLAILVLAAIAVLAAVPVLAAVAVFATIVAARARIHWARPRHASAHKRPSESSIPGSIRYSGPVMDRAATHAPAGSNTGAATAISPSSSSATAVA